LVNNPMITANVIEIEGLAMNGLINKVELENCERPPGWARIKALTRDGRVLSTACMEPSAARRNFMVLSLYVRKWGSLVNKGGEVEGPSEE
jgi:hypothetical protein